MKKIFLLAFLVSAINMSAQPSGGGRDSGGAYSGVQDVDFETIWGQGHTEAEDSGSASSNFISWVNDCVSNYTTGISKIAEGNTTDTALYDLQGRRVDNPSCGIYIQNGKKIINK